MNRTVTVTLDTDLSKSLWVTTEPDGSRIGSVHREARGMLSVTRTLVFFVHAGYDVVIVTGSLVGHRDLDLVASFTALTDLDAA